MRSSDFLHRLIKSLSKGDRRNFKVYARLQDGDKKYVQLFDAIGKQDVYDEKKLLKQFKGERFTNQFSVAKNYLYNYILKTLHVFQKDPHAELTTLIHQVEILIGKNLFDQAQKLLRKAKHMAERHERFGELLELLYHERQILHQRQKAKEYDVFIEDIQRQEREANAKMQNLMEYFHLYDDVYRLIKKAGSARGEEEGEEVRVILAHEMVASDTAPLSTLAKIKRFQILVDGHRFLHEYKKSLELSVNLIELYDQNPSIRKENNDKYIKILSNLGNYSFQLGDKAGAVEAMDKLKGLDTFSENEDILVFESYFILKLGYCIDTLDFQEGVKAVEEFETQLPGLIGKFSKSVELTMYYLIGYLYFLGGQPSSALPWVNRILNEPRTELRMDFQCMARLLNLIVHYDLGNRENLGYDINSAYRFISNRNRLFGFERTILKHLRALANIHPDQLEVDLLDSFKSELGQVFENPKEKTALNTLDILSWIDAKISKVPIVSLIALRAGKSQGDS